MRIIVAALSAVLVVAGCSSPGGASDTSPGVLHGPYPVVRAVDGDTIRVVRGGEEIVVRLIGLDTPETVAPDRPVECFGPEASERTTDLVTGGEVWLEYDEASGLTDKYDRTLAFVWLDADTMLNEILIAEGFAEEVTYTDGYAHQSDFRQAESRARNARAGLWDAC
ncbi:MAG: hypothetical protein FJW85_00360 [Actinobacteria bacterium]|nr:hypothetical protein [Actinomycetota bacterium]